MGNGRGQARASSSFHFAAGLGSGLSSAILLQPADLLQTRLQQSHNTSLLSTVRLIASGPSPIRQFWRGTLPSALRTGIGSALYFTTLNSLRQHVARSTVVASPGHGPSSHSSSLPRLSHTANLLTGSAARTMAGFTMMPITVIKVRYESTMYSYTSLLQAGRDIVRHEGLRGFFAGFGATAARDAPYAGLYVLFYEWSKRSMSKVSVPTDNITPRASAVVNSLSATLAACLATAITNPFDAIKTRLQLMPAKYRNMPRAAKIMLRDEGVTALFDGLALRIARKAISSALAWTVYEELIRRAEASWVVEGMQA